jgi:hypothetical protein
LAPGMPKTILTPALERESTITLARLRFDISTVLELEKQIINHIKSKECGVNAKRIS